MKWLRLIAIVLAIALATPFLVIGLIVGPMKFGFDVGLELWSRLADSTNASVKRRRVS